MSHVSCTVSSRCITSLARWQMHALATSLNIDCLKLWPLMPPMPNVDKAMQRFCAQAALMKAVQGQAKKGPLRYLERIKVDTVRLGKQQPALSSCTASTDAAAGCVQLALPFSFAPAEGFSIVVSAPAKPPCGSCCTSRSHFSLGQGMAARDVPGLRKVAENMLRKKASFSILLSCL